MVDVTDLQRALALCSVRACLAGRTGDEVERAQALEEADNVIRLLDRLESEAEWSSLAGSPDHG